MSFVRVLLAWLLVATLPLQGHAAASMVSCGQGKVPTAQAAPPGHAGHGQHHALADDAMQAAHDGAAATSHSMPEAGATPVPDGHSCPICAACCNLLALAQPQPAMAAAQAASVLPRFVVQRVTTRVAPAPDKPPRT